MKKQALTFILILLSIKSVSACSYVEGYDPALHKSFVDEYAMLFFVGTFVLFIPIAVL
jgi:hypothetical protein